MFSDFQYVKNIWLRKMIFPHAAWAMQHGQGWHEKITNIDFHEILPLDQFKSESKEFFGYFYVKFLVFTRQLI